jgi:hypothetical protein
MIAFIDDHREAYGFEPICNVLPIAPSTYHDHVAKRRDPARLSASARRDAAQRVEVRRVFEENFSVYGVRKVWRQSMPITAGAGEVSSFCDMACSLSSVPPASITCWQGGSTAGPSHYRTREPCTNPRRLLKIYPLIGSGAIWMLCRDFRALGCTAIAWPSTTMAQQASNKVLCHLRWLNVPRVVVTQQGGNNGERVGRQGCRCDGGSVGHRIG